MAVVMDSHPSDVTWSHGDIRKVIHKNVPLLWKRSYITGEHV